MFNEELEHINGDYYEWLVDLVDPDNQYLTLLSILFDKTFNYDTAKLIPNDDNRIGDALELRESFIKEQLAREPSYLIETFRDQTCSVLEILISLDNRMDDVMGVKRSPKWFWEMIGNLGMGQYNDDHMYEKAFEKIDRILDNWLNREYCKDGRGGLFPLKEPHDNQKKIEIWYQMSAYLLENYM